MGMEPVAGDREFKNKKKLMDAALDEFSRHSYREASLNRIIKKAQVSKGSFYFHFKDKKSLYLYMFKTIAKIKIDFFKKHSGINKDFADKDIFELIKSQSRLGIKFSAKYPKFYDLWLRFNKEEDSVIQEMVIKKFRKEVNQAVRPLVEKSMENGKLRQDFDQDKITRIIIHLLINFTSIFPVSKKSIKNGSYLNDLDKYMDFIKNGLARR